MLIDNTWIMVFLYKGIIASTGYTMPLSECIQTMQYSEHEQVFCVHTQRPSCKVYRDVTKNRGSYQPCLDRMKEKE